MKPYDLNGKEENSDKFYTVSRQFTDKVTDHLKHEFKEEVLLYGGYIDKNQVEERRTDEEYLFELLTIGLLWNNYICNAMALMKNGEILFERLYKLRQNKKLKKIVDRLRGILSFAILTKKNKYSGVPGIENLIKLRKWLGATGEFEEEVKRIDNWINYLKSKGNNGSELLIFKCLDSAYWFESESVNRLGEYTKGVQNFITENRVKYRFREDLLFCMRRENEYHLNIVGAQIMNNAFYSHYSKTHRKIALIPFCMSQKGEKGCKGVRRETYIDCVSCSDNCNVNKIKEEAEKSNFDIFVIPHSSNFTKTLEIWKDQTHSGIVGVACILNLLTGGYEMKRLNIPGQCVLLDYCGCSKHWDKQGIPTDLNIKKLVEVICEKE